MAFLSDRDSAGRSQIHTISRLGGESDPLTAVEGNIEAFWWLADGTRIAFLLQDPPSIEETKRLQIKDDPIVFEQNPKFSRIWLVDVALSQVQPLSPEGLQVWECAPSPDGSSLALIVSDFPAEWSWYRARLIVLRLADSEVTTLLDTVRQLTGPVWSPDSTRIAVLSCTWSDRGVGGGDVLLVPAAGGPALTLTENSPYSATQLLWPSDAAYPLSVGYSKGDIAVWENQPTGGPQLLWSAEGAATPTNQPTASISENGSTLALVREDPEHPQDLWLARRTGSTLEWRQLTQLHPQTACLVLGKARTLHWKANDGTPIQGRLVLPVDHQDGKPCPLLVLVHGGPAALHAHTYLSAGPVGWAQLLAGMGIATLLPNPRGSSGWGTAFSEANLGDMGGADLGDILAGVDRCVELGIANAACLGIAGWSYGGFMTAWAISQTNRFRMGIMGAGIANWRSFHGVTEIPTWDALFHEASPYELGGKYDRFSAITNVDRVQTPLLILHGQQDLCVPVGQSYEYYRALKERRVPVELVVYPREGHAIREREHVRDLHTRVMAWCGRYLLGDR